ncbi:MAG: ABC transporter ATP-binding protein [Lautropia sp.]
MAKVIVDHLVVRYGTVTAVDDVSFTIGDGKLAALLGPSGCGKTTSLRAIAGLEPITSGSIAIGERVVASDHVELPPEKRDINMVFQSYAIWPHLTVFDNVAYGLRVRRMRKPEIAAAVHRVLETVGLSEFASRMGTELSGGQQQRVAVARAVVTEPSVLLFDEPLSNLDAALRVRMRGELRSLQQAIGKTALYVTHDQQEAMAIADVILLMNRGRIEQMGPGEELYSAPKTAFVARFIGTANMWPGKVSRVLPGEGYLVDLDDGRSCATALGGCPDLKAGDKVEVVIRPEDIDIAVGTAPGGAVNTWDATLTERVYLGNVLQVRAEARGGTRVGIDSNPHLRAKVGDAIALHVDPERVVCVRQDAESAAAGNGDAVPEFELQRLKELGQIVS